jgi:2,4-dienoyl-CoA reductase-like NADH-dependent reductase (Old Yellow Enzyme family)/thioredoxin reductase
MAKFRSLMGRRQFMAGAAATSASALLCKGFSRKTGTAAAAETAGAQAAVQGGSPRYAHLLSPLKVGNVVLKNRMIHSRSLPHFFQGPESFPSEQVISHYATVARSAAVVTLRGINPSLGSRDTLHGDSAHNAIWNINDPSVHNYISQMVDAVHFYGAKASLGIYIPAPKGYTISNASVPGKMGMGTEEGNEIPVEKMQAMIDDTVAQLLFYQTLGFDMVNIYMSYRAHLLAHALSPALNKRTDKYGGSRENRARFPLELFQAIKKACGPDFLIEAQISGEESEEGGFTIEDVVEYAKIWEGSADIIQLRAVDGNVAHPVGLNSLKQLPITLQYAEAIKKSGAKVVTAPIGGYQDLGLNDGFIKEGKTDMVAMARAYICDPEYGLKAYEGRGEDVIPCIRCNDCHGISKDGPWFSWCSVNPKLGIAHRLNRMVDPPTGTKRVAVVGGGPSGMKAAIVAAERGHAVTIYEKTDFLGGQSRHSEFDDAKWPMKDLKDYLIRQVKKQGIEVLLKTPATPEMIKAKGYDAVIVASGASPVIPDIPGANGSTVRAPIFVYGAEKTLGKNVVVVGGRQLGTETGIYLAQSGHNVTVLTEDNSLAPDANQIHFSQQLREAWEALSNFKYVTNAKVTEISSGEVSYVDRKGNNKSVPADNVVVYAGREPRRDEALTFFGSARQFFIIGDCSAPGTVLDHADGNIAKSMRTALAAASQI